jgi:hypothetical protein
MQVALDGQDLGRIDDLTGLAGMLAVERLEMVVWSALDSAEFDLHAALDLGTRREGEQLELYTFDGWLLRSARRVGAVGEALPGYAEHLIVVSAEIELSTLMLEATAPVLEVVGELAGVREHLAPEVAEALDSVTQLCQGAEVLLNQALLAKDFVCLADTLRMEWAIACSALEDFLDPSSDPKMPSLEAAPEPSPDELYQANLAAFEARFPKAVDSLRRAWTDRDTDRYGFDLGPSGLSAPVINNLRQWSVICPQADARTCAQRHAADSRSESWAVACTFGLPGDQAFKILNQERPKRPVLMVRLDLAGFAAEMHCVDLTEALGSSETLVITSMLELRWALRNLVGESDQLRRLSCPSIMQIDTDAASALHTEAFRTAMTRHLETFTGISRAQEWIEKALINVPRLLGEPDLHRLKGRYEGLPGLLVAPGPSLKKNIHLIPQFAEVGVVVGVSHVESRLQEMGVYPELSVAIEANDISSHYDDADVTRTSIVVSESSAPEVVGLPAAQFWVMHDVLVGNWLREEEVAPPKIVASSCTHVVFHALRYMGCNPIYLVGLDLALADDGRQYTDGCIGWTPQQATLECEGYDGGTVQTIAQYNTFRDQFELMFATDAYQKIRIVNCTEGGAKIENTEQITFAEAIAEVEHLPKKTHSTPTMEFEDALPKPDWARVAEAIETSAVDLEAAAESAKKARRQAAEAMTAFRVGDEGRMQRKGRTAAKLGEKANQVITDDHVLSSRWMAMQNETTRRFEREATYMEPDSATLMRHNLTHYLQLLGGIEEGAATLLPHYRRCAAAIRETHDV